MELCAVVHELRSVSHLAVIFLDGENYYFLYKISMIDPQSYRIGQIELEGTTLQSRLIIRDNIIKIGSVVYPDHPLI